MNRILVLFAALAVLTLASCGGGAQEMRIASATQTVVVTPYDLWTPSPGDPAPGDRWFFYNDETDTIDNTLGTFVTGPGNPPLGSESVEISVSGTQRRNLATYQFSGTPLADITELAFSTYNPSVGNGGSADRSGYLNFNVDFNSSDGWQKRLVFVPSDNGAVAQDSWQSWDTLKGGAALWRWSGGSVWPDGYIGAARTWASILAAFPSARIRVTDSWLGIRVGEPYADGYTENIDAFVFGTANGTTTFDFEATALAHCRDHWKEMGFKNYGQCVSFHKKDGQQGGRKGK